MIVQGYPKVIFQRVNSAHLHSTAAGNWIRRISSIFPYLECFKSFAVKILDLWIDVGSRIMQYQVRWEKRNLNGKKTFLKWNYSLNAYYINGYELI